MKTLFHKYGKIIIIAAILACLLGIAYAILPNQQHEVHAGNNGQVVIGQSGARMGDAYVYGYNQSGNYASWHGSANNSTSFITTGYWWIGSVHLDAYNNETNQWLHWNCTVPKVWGSNTFTCNY